MSPSRILQSVTARRSMKRLALAVLGATILFVPIAWASFDDGLQAAKSGDYEKAMELYRADAADGDLTRPNQPWLALRQGRRGRRRLRTCG